MAASVFNVAFDCADPYRLAQFWSEVTGRPIYPGFGPDDDEVVIGLGDGTNLFFNRVPEGKRDELRTTHVGGELAR